MHIVGCSSLRSVPYPTYFNSLESLSVEYNRKNPRIDLSLLASQSNRDGQLRPDKEILVSVSGGGARATAFSLGVLSELENLSEWTYNGNKKNALLEIDYFSTVSGGGWGVAAYLADKVDKGEMDYSLSDRMPSIKSKFMKFSKSYDKCLPTNLEKFITNGMKFNDIYKNINEKPDLPYLFPNITIAGNQSSFIPFQSYFNHYQIKSFGACNGKVNYEIDENVYDLPVSYAVAISGSVPGFHHGYATTTICAKGSALYKSFYCSSGKARIDQLTLVDGGIYDNYGYQTALEIMESISNKQKKLIIIVDSNADTEVPFVESGNKSEVSIGINTLFKAGFPARTTAFNRIFPIAAKTMDIDVIHLDFFGTILSVAEVNSLQDSRLLNGLDILKKHAETKVNCFSNDGKYIYKPMDTRKSSSYDCMRNNFYRSGLMGKTTYKFDDYYFDVLEQLGRLVVRLHANELHELIYQ